MSTTQSDLCIEIHKHVDERLNAHDAHFEKNDEEIKTLKESEIRTVVVVEHLCKKIDMLVGVFVSIFLMLFGFLVWYIQSGK